MARRTVMSLLVLALLAALPAEWRSRRSQEDHPVSNGVNDVHPAVLGAKKFKEVVEIQGRRPLRNPGLCQRPTGDDVRATESVRAGTLEMVIPSTSPPDGAEQRADGLRPALPLPNSQGRHQGAL